MRQRGFTLIEMLIVGACVAVLAALAYPSYLNTIQKSRRSDAKSALVGAAGQMERYFTERSTYATAALGTGAGAVYPSTTQNGYYTLSISGATATTYTLTATPAAQQVGDECGNFTYTDKGVKGVTGSRPVGDCW